MKVSDIGNSYFQWKQFDFWTFRLDFQILPNDRNRCLLYILLHVFREDKKPELFLCKPDKTIFRNLILLRKKNSVKHTTHAGNPDLSFY